MEIDRANDILDKWEFFYGQRAGRELWADKPTEVQNEDIANFCRDLGLVREALERTRWIPVSERLPESDEVWQKYIVVYSYRTFAWDGEDTVVTVADYNSEQKIWSLDNGEVINALIPPENIQPKASYITHWMPLPKLPKEGRNEP